MFQCFSIASFTFGKIRLFCASTIISSLFLSIADKSSIYLRYNLHFSLMSEAGVHLSLAKVWATQASFSSISTCLKLLETHIKGVYTKYVGRFFKNYFVAQGVVELNISWPSSFFAKYFMVRPISFSFLCRACLR